MKITHKTVYFCAGVGAALTALQLKAADTPAASASAQVAPITPAAPPPAPPGRGGQPGGGGAGRGRGGPGAPAAMDPAAEVRRLDMALKLTDDEKSKITAIYEKNQKDLAALRATIAAGTPQPAQNGRGARGGRAGGGRGGNNAGRTAAAPTDDQVKAAADARTKLADLQKSINSQVRALLTAEKQKLFDAMPAPPAPGAGGGRGAGGAGGRQRGGAAPATTPPPAASSTSSPPTPAAAK